MLTKTIRTACLILAALTLSPAAIAQDIAPRGILQSIAIDPSRPANIYTAGSGKVYFSQDGGERWSISDTVLFVRSIKAHPAAGPDDQPLLVAGTDEFGVMTSLDGGRTWAGSSAFLGEVRAVAIHPDGQTIFAASEFGVHVSADRGATWTQRTDVLGGARSYGLVIDPDNPNNVYVSSWNEGVYTSTDAGQTFTLGNAGMPYTQIFDLDLDPANPSTLYASTPLGVYRSVDAGMNWSQLPSPFDAQELAIDPVNPSRMYLATLNSGIHRSDDAGESWTAIDNGLEGVVQFPSIAVAPDGSGSVYAGTVNEGIFISRNGGDTWTRVGESHSGSGGTGGPTDTSTSLTVRIDDLMGDDGIGAGDRARYRITITNSGSATANNAIFDGFWVRLRTFSDNEPMPFTATTSAGSCSNRICSLGNIPPGQSRTVDFSGNTLPGILTRYRIYARAEADNAGRVSMTAEIGPSVTIASSDGGGGSQGPLFLLLLMSLLIARLLQARNAGAVPPLRRRFPCILTNGQIDVAPGTERGDGRTNAGRYRPQISSRPLDGQPGARRTVRTRRSRTN